MVELIFGIVIGLNVDKWGYDCIVTNTEYNKANYPHLHQNVEDRGYGYTPVEFCREYKKEN